MINCLTESTHCGGHVSSWIELQEQIANVPKVITHQIILCKIGSVINVQRLKDTIQVREGVPNHSPSPPPNGNLLHDKNARRLRGLSRRSKSDGGNPNV